MSDGSPGRSGTARAATFARGVSRSTGGADASASRLFWLTAVVYADELRRAGNRNHVHRSARREHVARALAVERAFARARTEERSHREVPAVGD